MMQLRPYQTEAKAAVLSQWQDGARRTLLVLPTGMGKTIVFASVIEAVSYTHLDVYKRQLRRCLIFSPIFIRSPQ